MTNVKHIQAEKIQSLYSSMRADGYDGLLITHPLNIRYLTGFFGHAPHEREAYLFFTSSSGHLFTYSTYIDGIVDLPDTVKKYLITPEHTLRDQINTLCEERNIQTIGYEHTSMTMDEYTRLKSYIPITWKHANPWVESMREKKNQTELQHLKKAAALTDEIYHYLLSYIKIGMSEWDIAIEIEYQIKKKGADISFPPIVAFDHHAAIPHHIPSHTNILHSSHAILIDFGAQVSGYCADLTRMIYKGKPSAKLQKLHTTVQEAQQKALNFLSAQSYTAPPSIPISQEVDILTRSHIAQEGYTPYQHGLGHGVGLAIHEMPRLGPHATNTLSPGMCVTVEPGIYIPGFAGVRIEDLILCKDMGIEILSHSPKDIICI